MLSRWWRGGGGRPGKGWGFDVHHHQSLFIHEIISFYIVSLGVVASLPMVGTFDHSLSSFDKQ